ncbi:TIGR02302 family protein [Nitratireductor sp. StC3]|uniref:TIGR02302 family protein n=1 Tax=Nitratireductor sp. StC3 TaxID=2126741 RepID=UPI001FE1D159|nr:TIGR02302 family protein [Nitratireductor sp. StC3]
MATDMAGRTGANRSLKIGRTRFSAGVAMLAERGWPLVLPLVLVVGLFLAASWFGLFRLLPDWARIAAVIGFGLAALAALYPLRSFRWPTPAEIDRRIERANRLRHRPVTAQADRPAGVADDFSDALWREHQRRLAEGLGALSGDLPRPRVPERDPWALRALVPLLLVVGFAFSASPYGGRLGDAFRPHAAAGAVPARIDAWVTPPSYTGKPPVFLTAEANREQEGFEVPAGSEVSLRVTGGSGEERLAFRAAALPEGSDAAIAVAAAVDGEAARPGVSRFVYRLAEAGSLALMAGTRELDSWAFTVIADRPPRIAFVEEPKRAVNGTLELVYEIEDDYGAASARAIITQRMPPPEGARPLYEAPDLPLSLPRRGADENRAKTARDLTEHPWAGVAVGMRLAAVDDAGQEATSEDKTLVLPERPFTNPLARAVIEQRRLLALDANRKSRVLALMDAVTLRPEDTFDTMAHYLGLVSARERLALAEDDEALRGVVDYLWEIALGIEDGDLTAAEKRLRAAQQALRDALENGASDEEIERLMAELREAMQDFLREFAERAARDPNMAMQMPQDGEQLRRNDIDRMLDQIEDLARSGARDKAQELLSQLQNMMNNLQAGRHQRQQGDGQQSEMRQQMDRLGEIMRRQQEMMNETHRLDQMQRGQRGQQPGQQRGDNGEQGQQGQGGMSAEEFAEALRQLQEGQGQLRGELGELTDRLEGMGIQPGQGFGEAGEAMGEAGEALGEGQGDRAVGEQGRALEALRRGAQDMMQQMRQAMQGEQGGSEEGGRQQNADRDPLGRPRATTGPDFGDTVEVPDEIDVQRARRILEAIRRRLGDALSPELEKDYLERLLQLE